MDFTLPSFEIRWFSVEDPGCAPQLIELGAVWGAPVVHVYLRASEPGLGLKWRDDVLEVKQRLRVADAELSVGALSAHPEHWVKWRLDPPEVSAPTAAAWIQVRKRRLLGTVASCQVELTEFAADGRRGFTFALESWEAASLVEGAAVLGEALPPFNPAAWTPSGWPAFLAGRSR